MDEKVYFEVKIGEEVAYKTDDTDVTDVEFSRALLLAAIIRHFREQGYEIVTKFRDEANRRVHEYYASFETQEDAYIFSNVIGK